MELSIDKNTRIHIIEGVAGSGKSTLQRLLEEQLKDKLIYSFKEEELLFSWKHAWIKDIDKLRLDFMNVFLDYCEDVLHKNSKAVFILDRFHLSFFYLAVQGKGEKKLDKKLEKDYAKVIERLRQLPVHLYLPLLHQNQIEDRSSHKERIDETWKLHLQKRLAATGFSTLTDMYVATQKILVNMAEKQGIPYTAMDAI
ncbi:AAA family ATPase [Candidatus Woesearchaeota archaeon]|nr:AAA family ATPase [Candidatus Woesearchaeota archaeon]